LFLPRAKDGIEDNGAALGGIHWNGTLPALSDYEALLNQVGLGIDHNFSAVWFIGDPLMKRALMGIGSFPLALALCGMTSRYVIRVVQEGSSISFEFERNVLSLDGAVEVNSFFVASRGELGKWDYKHPLWAFALAPGAAKHVSRITYGRVPVGFKETTKAMPLAQGAHYLMVATTAGSGGSVEFVAH
jgi:hypothetical protein